MTLLSSDNAGHPEHGISQPELREIPVVHGPGISPEGVGGCQFFCVHSQAVHF